MPTTLSAERIRNTGPSLDNGWTSARALGSAITRQISGSSCICRRVTMGNYWCPGGDRFLACTISGAYSKSPGEYIDSYQAGHEPTFRATDRVT